MKKWILFCVLTLGLTVWATQSKLKADLFQGGVFNGVSAVLSGAIQTADVLYSVAAIPGSCTNGDTRVSSADNRLKVCTGGVFLDPGIKTAAGAFSCAASPTVTYSSGNVPWTITRVSGATCRINFSGFTSAPACVCSGYNSSANIFCLNSTGTTASGVTFLGSQDNGGGVDSTFSFICTGY